MSTFYLSLFEIETEMQVVNILDRVTESTIYFCCRFTTMKITTDVFIMTIHFITQVIR